ncbi:MAG: hypothetical protein HQL95_06640 [Magnetococcales bacterium]|nr:hypothetical protein [Magnetococcales bacterium]
MKTLVECHHCGAGFQTVTDQVPAWGRPTPCPLCGNLLVIWRPDAFYTREFSKEIALFLLDCKQATPAADAKAELAHLTELEAWLAPRHISLAMASGAELTSFLDRIRGDRSEQEADAFHKTLYRFYQLLTQKEWIQANPLPAPALWEERVPAPLRPGNPSVLPAPPLRGHGLWLTLLLFACGAVGAAFHLSDPSGWEQSLRSFLAGGPGPDGKTEASREQAMLPPRVEPLAEAARLAEAEMDRWAQEVVERAKLIRQADLTILELRKERAKKQTRENALQAIKPTPAPPPATGCQTGNCRDGSGVFRFANGDLYQGGWRNGQRHGNGVYTYASREQYTGAWRNDRMEGRGSFLYANGSRYEGEWLDNQRHGTGTMIQPNGDKHVGEWRFDKRHGLGSRHLLFAEQLARQRAQEEIEEKRAIAEQQQARKEEEERQSVAQAMEQGKTGCLGGDCQNGPGVYVYPSGDWYSGDWLQGERHGQGSYAFKSGDRYSGEWRHNQKHGQGSYFFKDGQRYEGGWQLNKKHGVGTIIFANGLRIRGVWENGEQLGQ